MRERTDTVDVLINNAAGWLEGRDLDSASDEEIVTTIMSGGAGTVLASKYFLPLLTASGHGDIVNVISMAASRRSDSCAGHPAFYAAKGAQANFADVLSQRLRDSGVRVISLFPPDFHNGDPLQSSWHDVDRSDGAPLTAQSVLDCIMFAVDQPRDCYIRSIEFEPSMPRQG